MSDGPDDLLRDCAREPIHVPGSIMPFGMLLSLSQDRTMLLRASANAAPFLTCAVEEALGRPAEEVLAPACASLLDEVRALRSRVPQEMGPLDLDGRRLAVTAHPSATEWIVELEEPTPESGDPGGLYEEARRLVERIHGLDTVEAMCQGVAEAVHRIVGFDRVLVYRFEENWDGVVVAEITNERLPSYLGLRFPAHDIPAQARALYVANRFRQIPDADYRAVPILGDGAHPLDLGLSVLRSVSPVHLQYMRNMGTAASMSMSIVVDGRLWGLVSCHHAEPRRVAPTARAACNFVGQLVALGIAGHVRYAEAAARVERQRKQAQLLAAMAARPRFIEGLLLDGDTLLTLAGADGAAVLVDGSCVLLGTTPAEPLVRRIAAWLAGRGEEDVFCTASLGLDVPDFAEMAGAASGLLAISISQIHPSFVLWFRSELVRCVEWAGDPHDAEGPRPQDPPGRISPRRSFATWKETVRGRSRPWGAADLEAARELRSAIVNIVLRRAEQMADISRELERSNKELEAFSYSISHDLRAPFRHIVGYAELLRERDFGRMDEKSRHYVDTIIDSAFSAGKLVDDLLRFSQMGRMTIQRIPVSMAKLAEEVIRSVQPDIGDRPVEIRVGALPPVQGDPNLLRQVLHNLVSNAVKYTRGRQPAVIDIDAERHPGEVAFRVRDNGVGFDMAYVGKLFGVFQRLHRAEEFEGTGIGLANVRRIVERHGGRVSAEGRLDEGALFTFTLPVPENAE